LGLPGLTGFLQEEWLELDPLISPRAWVAVRHWWSVGASFIVAPKWFLRAGLPVGRLARCHANFVTAFAMKLGIGTRIAPRNDNRRPFRDGGVDERWSICAS
jgi:hypothetical protein